MRWLPRERRFGEGDGSAWARFWTGIGVLLTVAMIVLSAFINYSFGYSLGLGGRGIQRPRLICAQRLGREVWQGGVGKRIHRANVDLTQHVSVSPAGILGPVEKVRVPDRRQSLLIQRENSTEFAQPFPLQLIFEWLEIGSCGRVVEARPRLWRFVLGSSG